MQAEIHKGGVAAILQLFSAPKRMGLEDAYTVLASWMELADKGAEIAEVTFRRAKKTPDFVWEGKFGVQSSGPLGRGPDICQHLTQHRSDEGLHPFSNSESHFMS